MASDKASGQEPARSALLRRRVGGSIDSNGRQNLGAGGKDSDSSRYGQESQVISAELNLAVSVPTLWRELKKLKLSCQKP